jgi:uncharacterized SAM-binding protein YcdF (DUF218 family)
MASFDRIKETSSGGMNGCPRPDAGKLSYPLSMRICLAIVLFLLGCSVAFLTMLYRSMPVAVQQRRSDVIVPLAGASDRAAYAAVLVEQGIGERLISTLVHPGCRRAGGDPGTCRTGVRNTVDEALLMRQVLKEEQVQRATIVTSPDHVLRAGAIFRIVFAGSDIQLTFASSPSQGSASPAIRLHELAKLFPSIAAALVGRLAPGLYRTLMEYRYRSGLFPSGQHPCES